MDEGLDAREEVPPAGFFDDAAHEQSARGIDPEKAAKEKEAGDWKEFQEMAAEATRNEEAEAEADEAEAEEDIERRKVEQAWYENFRLAPILKKKTTSGNGPRRPTPAVMPTPSAEPPVDEVASSEDDDDDDFGWRSRTVC